jgi:hypothetical protein
MPIIVNDKQQHEINVFQEFALRAALNIDPTSVQSREPPEPDIWCIGSGGGQYFELGRLLDNEMQRMKVHMLRNAPNPVSGSDYDVRLPEREMLKQKIAKRYQTDGQPLDLVLYYDNDNWLVGDVPAAIDLDTHYRHVMRPIIESRTQFHRVYVFERHRGTVLYRYPEF